MGFGWINIIYRKDNSRKYFTSLREILHLVTRADLMTIYGRVMTFYQDKKAEGVGLVLWGDLKVLIDSPEVNDGSDVWKNQNTWSIQSWKLYSYTGIHVLETVSGLVLHMFVDKQYPLSVNLIERMFDHQLEICRDTVGNELTTAVHLIAFLKKQISASRRPKLVVHCCLKSFVSWKNLGFWYTLLGIDHLVFNTADEHFAFKAHLLASPEQTATGKDTSNPFMAVLTCQKSYSSSTYYDSCSESGKWFQSSMDLTLSGPCFTTVFLVADSKFMKVAFGVGFKMLLFNPLVISTEDLSRNLKLTMSNSSLGEDFPTGKDNVIVSAGRTNVIPAGSTILVLVLGNCLFLRIAAHLDLPSIQVFCFRFDLLILRLPGFMTSNQHRRSVLSNEDRIQRMSHSIYVTNFPESINSRDLWRECSVFGTVVDVFIPFKKSQAGKRFAFVRFIKVFSLDRLVKNLCTIWIGRHHLYANQVRFERPNKPVSPTNNGMNKDSTKRQSFTGHKRGNNSGGSYAHVVNGGSSVANPASLISPSPALVLDETCVIERDFSKCVMGKVKDANSISNIQTFLHDEGFVDVKPKYLGGLWVMLEFEKEESKSNLLSHTGANSWFQTLQEVAQDFVSEERIAWIDIEGVPLHAWSFETFFRIGKKWGEMLNIEDTSVASFGRKRVCILTKNPVSILESFKIIVKGKVFMIRAKELFTWSPTFSVNKESICTSDDECLFQ
ncbi:RNA-directed DNA polymerase, eukaryota [Tanacetum coccineum]